VDKDDVSRWFGEYLEVFAAGGRGDNEASALLAYYGVPLLLPTDGGFSSLTREDQVVAVVQQQIDGMQAAAYDHTEVLASDLTVLNTTCALHRGTFSWQRADGEEIKRLTVTYLVTDGPGGRRISALIPHSS
jgi:hypothetical protein